LKNKDTALNSFKQPPATLVANFQLPEGKATQPNNYHKSIGKQISTFRAKFRTTSATMNNDASLKIALVTQIILVAAYLDIVHYLVF
jgi:hypothetical protein